MNEGRKFTKPAVERQGCSSLSPSGPPCVDKSVVTKEDYLMSLLPNLNQLSSPNRFGTVTFESLGEGILNGRSGPLLLFALLSGGKKII